MLDLIQAEVNMQKFNVLNETDIFTFANRNFTAFLNR